MNSQLTNKRRLAARILLGVFVPMLLLSSLHCHIPTDRIENICTDCANHVPHTGHFSVGSIVQHDCVLCQFLTMAYVAAAPLAALLLGFSRVASVDRTCRASERDLIGLSALRAPPSFC